MNYKILITIALSIFALEATASESIQREATLSEFQEAIGLNLTTTELNLDVPLYARFVLVTTNKGKTNESIIADLDFPATYFRFINVIDVRETPDPTKPKNNNSRKFIRMTSWNGKQRQKPQGRTFEFSELDVGPQSAGTSYYLASDTKVNVKEDIVVWDDSKVNTKDNTICASQKLVLRLFPAKPPIGEQGTDGDPH
jgi:hypothetical protein